MTGIEIAGIVIGGLASGEAARRTVWKWGRSLMHGSRAIAKFGKALPDLSMLPETLPMLGEKIDMAAAEARLVRKELREHMRVEDEVALINEKAWVNLIRTQHQLTQGQAHVRHEVANLQQIVMNQQESGSGDRWRLSQHPAEGTPADV